MTCSSRGSHGILTGPVLRAPYGHGDGPFLGYRRRCRDCGEMVLVQVGQDPSERAADVFHDPEDTTTTVAGSIKQRPDV